MKKTVFAIALGMLMLGCVTTTMLKLDPLTLDGQKKSSQDGFKTVTSEKNVRVKVRSATDTYTSEDRPGLGISVYSNAGAFTFSPKNIQVFVDGKPQRVFTYNELVADVRENQMAEKEKAEKIRNAEQMGGGGVNNANDQYFAMLNMIEKETVSALKELDATYLKSIRVTPGQEYSGHVTIEKIPDPSQKHEVKMIVTVNKETHEFLLNQIVVQK